MKPSHIVVGLACILGAALPARAQAQRAIAPPQAAPGTVTMTLDQYDRLLQRAEHPVKRPELPPIPAVLARADLRVRVAGDRARGTFTLDGEVFQTGPTRVPLIMDATLLDAHIGTTSVPMVTEGPMAVALVEGPRPFTIALDWGSALSSSPGRASMLLPVPMAGSASLSLDLAGHPADVRIAPGVITRITTANDVTHVEATLVPGTRAALSWSSRETTAPAAPQEGRTMAEVKTMVSVGDVEMRMTALVEVTVLRGEPERFEVKLPPGFTATGASGSALVSTEERPGAIVLVVQRPTDRRHQFLLSLERPIGDAAALETPLLSVAGVDRETGEVAVEASGTVELTAKENDTLRRMDIREASANLRSLSRAPLLTALRYHRRGTEPAVLSLNVTRFPDADVVAAVAERATVTTLVTVEGRTLTEIALTMRNRAQPFLRVELPQGASVVSAEVEGEASKPAQGADGARIPLLRPGFRPNGAYRVSFVYVQDGQAFAKKGRAEFELPKMDVPVTLVEWEMFVPDKYRLRRFDGNAMPMPPVLSGAIAEGGAGGGVVGGVVGEVLVPGAKVTGSAAGLATGAAGGVGGGAYRAQSGQVIGVVADPSNAQLPGVVVRALRDGAVVAETITDSSGWFMLSNVPSGPISIEASLAGFLTGQVNLTFDAVNARRVDFQLPVAGITETVQVTAASEPTALRLAGPPAPAASPQKVREEYAQAPSSNVFNLQRRIAGVLPVRVDVPRAGAAYKFVRPLVLDETTRVSFEYRPR
jgi:hypothetical protein